MADSRTAVTAESNLPWKLWRRPRVLISILDKSRYEIACLVSIGIESLREMILIEPVLTKKRELFLQRQPQFSLGEAHDVFALFLSNRADAVHNCSVFLGDVRGSG